MTTLILAALGLYAVAMALCALYAVTVRAFDWLGDHTPAPRWLDRLGEALLRERSWR